MTLAVIDQSGQAVPVETIQDLEARFALAVRQRELLESYIKSRLKPAKHFYTVSGSDKPSLTKDGAELICLPHGYKPRYDLLAGPTEPPDDDRPYQLTVKARLFGPRGDAGEGIGSANSHSTKRDGSRVPRQTDPGLRHNATLKMAQKSAYIAATLNSTAASEFFTQDLEDAHEDAPDKTQHWCQEHKTNWFKKGKMSHYAHPIGDTKEWCNEPRGATEASESSANGDRPVASAPAITHDQLRAEVEASGMTWGRFEMDVLGNKTWETFSKTKGASAGVAKKIWENWKEKQEAKEASP